MCKILPARVLALIFIMFCVAGVACAQVDTDTAVVDTTGLAQFYEMSLRELDSVRASGVSSEMEKLINSLIAVASKKSMTVRESPNIITLITAEEIRKSGARDLIDVLRMVPGFDFGIEENSVIGLGIRGNWAQEGKVLMMIDGQEINDVYTARLKFGNHYPIDNIEKIEIIRGPGSAIYGGAAAFGVINIITRSAEQLNGVSVVLRGGEMARTYGRRVANISIGKKFNNSLAISASSFFGTGQRSDQMRTTFLYPITGDDSVHHQLTMAGKSDINPSHFNFGLSYRGFSTRAIFDHYTYVITENSLRNAPMSRPHIQALNYAYVEMKQQIKVGRKLVLTPKINLVAQYHQVSDAYFGTEHEGRAAIRARVNITGSYDLSRRTSFTFGAEHFGDDAKSDTSSLYVKGDTAVYYHNTAFFGQFTRKGRILNVIFGARYDEHNKYGGAFVPRLALTKHTGKMHFKFLYSKAFRAPTIGNIENAYGHIQYDTIEHKYSISERSIKPEKTTVIELEVGYQLHRDMLLSFNIFNIRIKDPIVAYSEDFGLNLYRNFDKTGTKGIEIEAKIKQKWGHLNLNYSYYSVAGFDRLAVYTPRIMRLEDISKIVQKNTIVQLSSFAEASSKSLLAFPTHKLTANGSVKFGKNFSINPSMILYGKRYGYDVYDPYNKGAGGIQLREYKPTALVNIFLNYDNLLIKGLSLGIGCYDIFDQRFKFLQPYFGLVPPMPGPSREFVARASYDLRIPKKKEKQ